METGDIPQNVNFAIKSSAAKLFLESHGISYEVQGKEPELTTPDIASMAQKFTFLIECLD